MQWRERRRTRNISDRRRVSTGPTVICAAIGAVVVVVVLSLQMPGCGSPTGGASTREPVGRTLDDRSAFISMVLADTEAYWAQQFESMDRDYNEPALVLFNGLVHTSAGAATSVTGPFYSPVDKTIYVDLSFYGELQDKYGAEGDAAQAYVIAHEVGHAVQDQLGVFDMIAAQEAEASDLLKSQLSVRVELQADFYAGLAARHQGDQRWLDEVDIEKAISAADAVGDGKLAQQPEGYAVPDSFTHGTSAQRVRWFRLGYESRDFDRGDTFSIPYDEL